ncbi:undecaprenyldiphospho-muramoylpentapeptide beta-N-acetylglucosaminyltransferase [Desulfospira joergensenii]|uniref:undecaprenyldiphospho-muramoylpentapeptide beta-N-acetylglucosaminyltransferase n=1 Tax=Desulfospira joergensenii TaxID=53329 RepID=UPI0003B37D96|nr:undecaprenyldiphospho-muramoylpentapeptide beta-N-acetylglucosaminyltransferase [Desulfospira joergensenii]
MENRSRIIIAGGKTGGHLFPGIAVAQALESADPGCRILFVGTNAPFEINTLERYGYDHRIIAARPVKGGSLFAKAKAVVLILVSLVQSLFIIMMFRPGFVLGVGGFSSFALVLAAWILRIPTAIQEQNTIPGITNRLLSRFSGTIFTAFQATRHMPESKIQWVGNPIRRTETNESDEDLPKARPGDFTILVTGGSQGAASINSALIKAAELLEETQDIFIIHQTGIRDEEEIGRAYQDLKIRVHSAAFFHDMGAVQDMADLVIARAGAGTLSELCIKGLPAVLIPFPHAADDHQTSNARTLEEKGGAVLIPDHELSGKRLAQTILELKSDPERLASMSRVMKGLAMPHAAERIAAHIVKEIKG